MIATAIFCLPLNGWARERIIILAPAAADIILRLNAGDMVAGVTNNVTEFPAARKVGTHLNPGLEVMAALKPTLLITTARFTPEMAMRLGAEQYVYDPKDLPGILDDISNLAQRLGKTAEGAELARQLEGMLKQLKPVATPPTVMYETRSNPLALAKDNSIIQSMLETAGFSYAYHGSSGIVSMEWLLVNQPDYYIYQIGPMNRDPLPPNERTGWQNFNACVWAVAELEFARPNTELFAKVLQLNAILTGENSCETGKKLYISIDLEP